MAKSELKLVSTKSHLLYYDDSKNGVKDFEYCICFAESSQTSRDATMKWLQLMSWLIIAFASLLSIAATIIIAIPIFYGLLTWIEPYELILFYPLDSLWDTLVYCGVFLLTLYFVALLLEVIVTVTMTLVLRIPLSNASILGSTIAQAFAMLLLFPVAIEPFFKQLHFTFEGAFLVIALFYVAMYFISGDDRFEEKFMQRDDYKN